jgi:hypothetical protein
MSIPTLPPPSEYIYPSCALRPRRPTRSLPLPSTVPVLLRLIVPRHLLIRIRTRPALPPALPLAPPSVGVVVFSVAVMSVLVLVLITVRIPRSLGAPAFRVGVGVGVGRGGGFVAGLVYAARAAVDAADFGWWLATNWSWAGWLSWVGAGGFTFGLFPPHPFIVDHVGPPLN